MARPGVVVYAEASADGRLTVAPEVLLLFGDERWPTFEGRSPVFDRLMEVHSPGAMLEGSGSFVLPGTDPAPLPPVVGDSTQLYGDFLLDDIARRPGFKGWFVVVDGRGRVRWYYTGEPGKEAPGSEGWHLLVLASQTTPAVYLAYLRRERVPYIVAGDRHVDLGHALEKLAALLGIESVLCTSPGKLGGALLRAGWVDEIDILWLPIVVGGTATPTLFEGPDLGSGERPTHLSLVSCETFPGGTAWLRYRVDGATEEGDDG